MHPSRRRILIQLGTVSFIIAIVTFVMAFLSIDSWLHDLSDRIDSSWFMMAGRAWAHGMTPYVDFCDSKGPLLWAIYAVGYTLRPHDYVGVFWLSWVAYVATALMVYKTARSLNIGRGLSLAVVAATTTAFFLLHFETRAEDFCLPFIAASVYAVCRLYYGRGGAFTASRAAAITGVAIGATLLIKFTIAAMTGIFLLIVLYRAWRDGAGWLKCLAWAAASALIVCLPFVVIFAVKGNLTAFLYEYFVRTTLISSGTLRLNFVALMSQNFVGTLYFVIMSVSTLLFAWRMKKCRFMAAIAFLWFFVITTQHANWAYTYNSCNVFVVFGFLALAEWASSHHSRKLDNAVLAIVTVAAVALTMVRYDDFNNRLDRHSPANEMLQRQAAILGQVKNPKLIYLHSQNRPNSGDLVDALPACRFWAEQSGATPEMKQEQLDEALARKADFVLVYDTEINRDIIARLDSVFPRVYEPDSIYKTIIYDTRK